MTIKKRIAKNGDISYLIRVSLGYKDGQQIVKSMTYKPEKRISQRKIDKEVNRQAVLFEEKSKIEYEAEQKLEAELQEQEDNAIAYAKQHTTFKELANEWLELQNACKKYKNSTLTKFKSCEERTYKAIGTVIVSKLTFRKVQAFITSLGKENLSVKTQKAYLNFVSDVMLYAKRCGIIEYNPCRDIVFTKNPTKEKQVYSLEEVKTLLSAIDIKATTDYKLFFNLLAYCGMRKSEVLGLEYKDVDFDKSILTINRTSNYHEGFGVYTDTPKTKSSCRSLYLQPKIMNLINQLKQEHIEKSKDCGDLWVENDRLFVTWCGKPLNPSLPYKWLQRFCMDEGIAFKGTHSFRHFAASHALASGVDVKSVSAMLGHSQTSTTLNIYAHAIQQANEKALNSIANLLENV